MAGSRVGLFDHLNIPIHRDAQHREDVRVIKATLGRGSRFEPAHASVCLTPAHVHSAFTCRAQGCYDFQHLHVNVHTQHPTKPRCVPHATYNMQQHAKPRRNLDETQAHVSRHFLSTCRPGFRNGGGHSNLRLTRAACSVRSHQREVSCMRDRPHGGSAAYTPPESQTNGAERRREAPRQRIELPHHQMKGEEGGTDHSLSISNHWRRASEST